MSRTRMGLLALPIAAAMVFTAPALASAAGGSDQVPSCCKVQHDSTPQHHSVPQIQTDRDEESYSQDAELKAAKARMEQAAIEDNLEKLAVAFGDVIECLTNLNAPADVIAKMEDHLAQAKSDLAALNKEHGKGKSPKAKDAAKKASKALDSTKKPKKIAAGGL